MNPNMKLSKDIGPFLATEDATAYMRLIGWFLYLQISQPDISFAFHGFSQFLQQLSTIHQQVVHRLLRYLKQSPGQGIILKTKISFQLRVFVDADCGACVNTRRSVTRFCVFLSDSLISWKSKKQHTVSRCWDRIYGIGKVVTSELIWINHLLLICKSKLCNLLLFFVIIRMKFPSRPIQYSMKERSK